MTIVILLSLATTSIIGTLIPQNETPGKYLQAFGEFLYKLFDVFDFFDMYHSWWFRLMIILLTVNIVICSIDRLSATWKIIFVKIPRFNIARFRNQNNKREFKDVRTPQQLRLIYEPIVAKGFGYRRVEEIDKGICIFAEKWRWSMLGVYVVHLSVICLLIGSLIGSIFGFEGYMNIPEGEALDAIRIRDSAETRKLDFVVRCDDFSVTYYRSGAPKEYRSSLTIVEQGKAVLKKDIIVNDPLRYRGINLFQSSYGKLPPRQVTLTIESGGSGKSYTKQATIGEPFILPEDMGKFEIKKFNNSANFRGHNLGEAFIGVLEPTSGQPLEILLPLRYPSFDKMRKGDQIFSAAKFEQVFYTGLQVTKDPGVWVVYSGFILMIVGCFLTFFMSHQRICVEVVKSGKKSKIMISGIANKNKYGMEQKIDRMFGRLSGLNEDEGTD